MLKTFNDTVIEVIRGDIANQPDMDTVVNAANAQLRPGGGVAGALHRAAGPGLDQECRALAPIRPGQAVITGAHNLPNRHVIHCLGPVYGVDRPEGKLLADCYRSALRLADGRKVDSIAFPSLSTGVFGYPVREAARVAMKAVREVLPELENIRLIRFVLFSEGDREVYEGEGERTFNEEK